MSHKTINRAIEAAQDHTDPLVRATGELLRQVRNDAHRRRGTIEHERRAEAINRAVRDRTPEADMDAAINRHLADINREKGPLPTEVAPTDVLRHDGPLTQAAATARALLTQLGAGQDGEVWPGQQATSVAYGWVEVAAVEMDGSYRVQKLGWGSYPSDPTRLVPADDVTAHETTSVV